MNAIRGLAASTLLCACAPSPGPSLAPGDHRVEVDHDGLDRHYELFVPEGSGGPYPLVLDFHGLGAGSRMQRFGSGVREVAEREGFAAAWPHGTGIVPSWNAETCCGSAASGDRDDVGFARAVVASIAERVSIDPARVYATGLSNGGALSHVLACRAADVFAAVAPIAFPLPVRAQESCQPSEPVGVWHAHGLQDRIVPYDGYEPELRSAPASFEAWRRILACDAQPSVTLEKRRTRCTAVGGCAGGAAALCSVQGGHILYRNADGIRLADELWAFVSGFRR